MGLSSDPNAKAAQLANLRPVSRDPAMASMMGKLHGFASGKHKQCEAIWPSGDRCKMPAAYGTPKCVRHGARKYAGTPSGTRTSVAYGSAIKQLSALNAAGLIDPDLERHPAWDVGKNYPRKLALVEAWNAMQNGDPAPWRNLIQT